MDKVYNFRKTCTHKSHYSYACMFRLNTMYNSNKFAMYVLRGTQGVATMLVCDHRSKGWHMGFFNTIAFWGSIWDWVCLWCTKHMHVIDWDNGWFQEGWKF
jgi:hypothetical protein